MSRLEQRSRPDFLRAGKLPHGVVARDLTRNRDERGSFTEIFCASWEIGIEPTQWSLVRSRAGVLRGMHVHRRHDEYFLLVDGRCCVGLHDIRPHSPTRGQGCLLEFSGGGDRFVCFPRGVVHGWYYFEPSVHFQAISEEYSYYYADDNFGCRWDDPALEILWPEQPTTISDRARNFPTLAALVKQVYPD